MSVVWCFSEGVSVPVLEFLNSAIIFVQEGWITAGERPGKISGSFGNMT